MPFHGYTPIPDADGKPLTEAARLIHWQVAEGTYVQPDAEVATVQHGEMRYSMRICFAAAIEKQLAEPGAIIPPGTDILRWVADGENIPYGKAYFRTQPKS